MNILFRATSRNASISMRSVSTVKTCRHFSLIAFTPHCTCLPGFCQKMLGILCIFLISISTKTFFVFIWSRASFLDLYSLDQPLILKRLVRTTSLNIYIYILAAVYNQKGVPQASILFIWEVFQLYSTQRYEKPGLIQNCMKFVNEPIFLFVNRVLSLGSCI